MRCGTQLRYLYREGAPRAVTPSKINNTYAKP